MGEYQNIQRAFMKYLLKLKLHFYALSFDSFLWREDEGLSHRVPSLPRTLSRPPFHSLPFPASLSLHPSPSFPL